MDPIETIALPYPIEALCSPDQLASTLQSLNADILHCGSGVNLKPGALNSDAMCLQGSNGVRTEPGQAYRIAGHLLYLQYDATQPFPLHSASLRGVYSEHFIEHLSWSDGIAWLRQMRSLLKPGGVLRLSTPDLAAYIAGYLDPEQKLLRAQHAYLEAHGSRNVPTRPSFMFNQLFFYWGHRWIYDFAELQHALMQAGFHAEHITRCSFQQGAINTMAAFDQQVRQHESLYIEAHT